jgi:acyl-CoA thioesterase-1
METMMAPFIEQGQSVLFQGDSITDAGRERGDIHDMGLGYAMMVSAQFDARFPELRARFSNRGISGDQTFHLRERWDMDCLQLKPNWLSILIGINDAWQTENAAIENPRTVEQFEDDYTFILNAFRKKFPHSRVIICEPFLTAVDSVTPRFRRELDDRIDVVRMLARKYATVYVPLDGVFQVACMYRAPEYWAFDGVHPTWPGNALIADAWMKAMRAV